MVGSGRGTSEAEDGGGGGWEPQGPAVRECVQGWPSGHGSGHPRRCGGQGWAPGWRRFRGGPPPGKGTGCQDHPAQRGHREAAERLLQARGFRLGFPTCLPAWPSLLTCAGFWGSGGSHRRRGRSSHGPRQESPQPRHVAVRERRTERSGQPEQWGTRVGPGRTCRSQACGRGVFLLWASGPWPRWGESRIPRAERPLGAGLGLWPPAGCQDNWAGGKGPP